MKLYLNARSGVGKPATKGGNEYLHAEFTHDMQSVLSVLIDKTGFIYIKDGKHNEIGVWLKTRNGTLEEVTHINKKQK